MKVHGKQFLVMGSFLAGLGVALGAVGSHALKDFLLENGRTETFEIAVRYQLYHSLALIVAGVLSIILKETDVTVSGILFLLGIIFFSGSLFALALTQAKWVAWLTPIGGFLMIGGWLTLFLKLLKTAKIKGPL